MKHKVFLCLSKNCDGLHMCQFYYFGRNFPPSTILQTSMCIALSIHFEKAVCTLINFIFYQILEKLGLDEYFTLVETYFLNAILPSVHGLLNDGESSKSHEPQTYSAEEEQQFNSLIEKIVVQCTASPHQVIVDYFMCYLFTACMKT